MQLSFWLSAANTPDRIAVIDAEGNRFTFKQMHERSNQIVHALRGRGLKRGDCIAALLPNCADAIALFMAAAQAGWYYTPINSHLAPPEIAYIVTDSGASAVFVHERYLSRTTRALDSIDFDPSARFVVGTDAATGQAAAAGSVGASTLDTFIHDASTAAPTERLAGGPMTYTSGTTGRPKGVRRPVADVDPETIATRQAMFLALFNIMPGSEGVHLVVAPLYHTAVLNFATNHLHLGHTVVLMDKWTAEDMLRCIDEYRVTSSHMVPTMFVRALKLPAEVRDKYDMSSLSNMVHGAAPCPVEIKRQMLEWWGDSIYEYYAASEGGGTTATPEDWRRKPGTVGKAWPISQLRILDDDNQPVESGTPGTVWIRMGEHRFEYHKDQKKTDKSWHEGFFTVGDAGYLDDDGFLFLCDRKADMIISGGVNIYPAEIESALVQHPSVTDVAVFGVPHEDWGEQVKAVIQPAEGVVGDDSLREVLMAYANENLARYKLPRSIDFTDELPRDPNGKLYKRRLRDPYWEGKSRGGAQ